MKLSNNKKFIKKIKNSKKNLNLSEIKKSINNIIKSLIHEITYQLINNTTDFTHIIFLQYTNYILFKRIIINPIIAHPTPQKSHKISHKIPLIYS
jgi:ABC-type multidrug transport system permease subunit